MARNARTRRAGRKRRPRTTRDGVPAKLGRNPNIPEAITVAREARAWELFQQGMTQRAIAEVLEREWPDFTMSQPAVCQALRRCEDRVLADLKDEQLREKARQLQRLEGIYLTSMQAFAESKAGSKRRSETVSGLPSGRGRTPAKTKKGAKGATPVQPAAVGERSVSTVVEASHGDPRFLEKALQALTDRRKILGIDAPTKFEGTFETKRRPHEALTPEELHEEIRLAQEQLSAMGVTIH